MATEYYKPIASNMSETQEPEVTKVSGGLAQAIRTPPPDTGSPVRSLATSSHDGSGDEPDHKPGMKQIRINITIDYPETLFNIRWNERKYKFGCRKLRCAKRSGHRFAKFLLGLFYFSFVICAITACIIRGAHELDYIPLAPLILACFSPFLDAIGSALIIKTIRKGYNPDEKRNYTAAIALIMNTLLINLQVVILVFACTWFQDYYGYGYWYWNGKPWKKAVIGLTMYSTITMLVIKGVLILISIFRPRWFKDGDENGASVRWAAGDYEALPQDESPDGRILPGTVVNHLDEDETPRNSSDRVRLL